MNGSMDNYQEIQNAHNNHNRNHQEGCGAAVPDGYSMNVGRPLACINSS